MKQIRSLFLGANPTVTTTVGRTAIGLACMKDNVGLLRELLGACANQTWPSLDRDVGGFIGSGPKKWRKNETPPMDSATPEGMDGLQWEDEIASTPTHKTDDVRADTASADDTVVDQNDEWSVLYQYYASVIEKTGEMLANTINAREPHCLDMFRKAPIHYAAIAGSYACVELLLKHNAPVNMATDSGHTALHLAVEHPRVVELLLQNKASPNKLTFFDQLAPIHIAAKIGNTETVSGIWKSFFFEQLELKFASVSDMELAK